MRSAEIYQLQKRHTVFEMADLSIGSDPPPDQKHDRIVSKATYADFKIDVSQLPDNMYTVSVSIKAAAASFKILKD